ncbi:MAG: histidine--tRNA ligase [Proteobacteria bacterium]|nr:histidine--tRNA ligase [Pseudomonadota bacterium]
MINSVRGFKDIYGKEAKVWEKLEKRLRESFSLWGFEEVRLPILEKTELFQRSIGDTTDIVEKEMYTFLDKSNESVTMRPEGTASIIRFLNEHKLYGPDKILKFFYIGPMFRYERPQKGRLRQFNQAGVELLGDSTPYAEFEVLSLMDNFLESIGIKDRMLFLNNLGCPLCRQQYRKTLLEYLEQNHNLCEDCIRRKNTNPLRVLDCKSETCKETIKNSPKILDFICENCKNHMAKLEELLKMCKIQYQIDPYIVRGLDYYVKTVFEVHAKGLGSQSAILAGGRYDNLSKDLGGYDIPAVGWALGIERTVLLLPENFIEEEYLDIFFIYFNERAEKIILPPLNNLRKKGIKVSYDPSKGSLKSKMRKADKLKSRYVVILGDDEISNGVFILKNMNLGKQITLPLEKLENLEKEI